MHDHAQLKTLARMDTLYNQAIHRASSIQARVLGEKPMQRNDKIYALADTDRVLHHLLEVFVTRLRNLTRNM